MEGLDERSANWVKALHVYSLDFLLAGHQRLSPTSFHLTKNNMQNNIKAIKDLVMLIMLFLLGVHYIQGCNHNLSATFDT